MEITESSMYWIIKLDNIVSAFGSMVPACVCLAAVSVFGVAVTFGMLVDSDIREDRVQAGVLKDLNRWFLILFIFMVGGVLVSFIGKTFTPTTKEMAAIKLIPVISRTDFIQKDLPRESSELYHLLKQYLQEQLKDQDKPETKTGK